MSHWTIDAPASLDFGEVTALSVRLIGGTVAVLATDKNPSLTVSEITGRPLQVDYTNRALTVGYEHLTWEHLLDFKPGSDRAAVTITVPADCAVRLGVVSASALTSGLTSGATVKGVSGDITLDGVRGGIEAKTISGDLQARSIDGPVHFESVSGELTLADSSVSALTGQNVNGRVTADITLVPPGGVDITTVSGEVTLRLPDDTDARVRLNSVSGKIQTEFDALAVKKAPASRIVSGSVGAGTGHVAVTSVTGTITLLRRPSRRTVPLGGDNPPGSPRRAAAGMAHAEPPRTRAGMESETR